MAGFDMSQVTEVLLADGWHTIQPGSLTSVQDIQIASGGGSISGGLWIGFADSAGVEYAFPVSPFIAVRYTP